MAASDLYPISTQDGKAVPLEIVKPLTLVRWTLVANAPQSITIPAGKVAWVYSAVDAILSMNAVALPAALVDGTSYPDAVFLPAGVPMVIEITPGTAYILSTGSGKLYMNIVTQWAALVQSRQTTVG